MISKYLYENLTWVDINQPTAEEIKAVAEEYHIDPIIANDLLIPTPRPIFQIGKDFFYAVLHFPVSKHSHIQEENAQELDFVVFKHVTITVHYGAIDAIERLGKEIEVRSIIDKEMKREEGEVLFFLIMNRMYESVGHELNFLNDSLTEVEKEIFKGKEREMVISLSQIIRNLLNFKKIMQPHLASLSPLHISGSQMFDEKIPEHQRLLEKEVRTLLSRIDNQIELTESLRETNDALLSTRQNEITKTLTVVAFITLPLSLIATIFSMNIMLPIGKNPTDFWTVLSVMGITGLLTFAVIKRQKWI